MYPAGADLEYLEMFLDQRDARLLIASLVNVVRFNYPISPAQAAGIARLLRRIEYAGLDRASVLAFVREMRGRGFELS